MISAILLAAGKSKRLKHQNKLTKNYKGKPLINHILKSLIKSKVNKIIIVLGFEEKKIRNVTLKSKKITFLITHADMPLISKKIINTLCFAIKNKNKDKEIFVPIYKRKIGNPLAFKYSMIKPFKKIKGDRGAKKLISSYQSKVQLVKVNSRSILIDFDRSKDFPSAI